MSHFLLMVVAEGDLDAAMEPFNEQPDGHSPYLEFEDCTEEVIEGWNQLEGMGNVRHEARTVQDPESGEKKAEIVEYKGIDDYAKKYHGYRIKNTAAGPRYGYLHNPQAKWDWYQVGGRWTGALKLKERPMGPIDPMGFRMEDLMAIFELLKAGPQPEGPYMTDVEKAKKAFDEKCSELMEKAHANSDHGQDVTKAISNMVEAVYPPHKRGDPSWSGVPASLGRADVARKKDVDIEGMERPKREPAARTWDEFHQKRWDGKSYADLFAACPNPSAENPFRNFYKQLPEEFKSWSDENMGHFSRYDDVRRLVDMSREQYIDCMATWHPFAVLWGGRWYESGKMGWWGISTDNEPQWEGVFKKLWEEIPNEATLIMVDCHI
jgi:hypothetical protein